MFGLAAKLARLSLNQNLRVLVKATRQRRALVLPLCGLPPLAAHRLGALPISCPDLFGGQFQNLVAGEAERRRHLKETTFSSNPVSRSGAGGSTSQARFRGLPSHSGGKRSKVRTKGSSSDRGRTKPVAQQLRSTTSLFLVPKDRGKPSRPAARPRGGGRTRKR